MENDFKKVISKACPSCGITSHVFFCKKKGHDIYRCRKCKMLSMYPVPQSTAHIYEDDYFSGGQKGFGYVNYDEDKEPMRKVFEEYVHRIKNKRGEKGILLDVGAATGFFMSIAEGMGWKTKGVEISKYAAMLAQDKGLDVIHGSIENMKVSPQFFDVVTMWDVVEHMPDPIVNLKIAHDILKPEGLLVLNTPDSGSLYAKLLGKRWHLLVPPEHIHYFNNKSIESVLSICGFETESNTRIGKKFTLEYVFLTLYKWLGFSFLRHVTSFLRKYKKIGQLSLPINLRDNMFVIATKKA